MSGTTSARIRALVVDDEPLSRRVLRQLLARHADVEVVAECEDGVEAHAALVSSRPDVLFLDVQMPELSGLDVALGTERTNGLPLVVFVTAYDQFAVPAFGADAVDYVTKPVSEERFDAALERVRERLRVAREAALYRDGLTARYLERLAARVGEREVVIHADEIDLIAADDVYACVHVAARRYLVRTSLDALEQSLDPARFARVHRSYIVPMNRVATIRRDGERQSLLLRDGTSIPVSRRRRGALGALRGAAR